MTDANIGALLDRIARFEQRLKNHYAHIRDGSNDNDMRLLAYYLARHHRHLRDMLKEHSPQLIEHIRKVKLQRDIPFKPEHEFSVTGTPLHRLRGPQLLDSAATYNAALMKLYRGIQKQRLTDRAQKLFSRLIRQKKREIVMLKKMAETNYF